MKRVYRGIVKVNKVSSETIQGLRDAGFLVVITDQKPQTKLELVKDDSQTLELMNEFSEFLNNKAS